MTKLFYKGRSVEKMSKEELIQALEECFDSHHQTCKTLAEISKLAELKAPRCYHS